MSNKFQRVGSKSNSEVGKKFEQLAKEYFLNKGIALEQNFKEEIGLDKKKMHSFDLGSAKEKIIVECKSHKWTVGNNTPSAKITVWNEAMYYFYLAPAKYKKILFVLKDINKKSKISLVDHYISNYLHLIPKGTLFYEYSEKDVDCRVINPHFS